MAQATDSQIAMWRGAIALLWSNQTVDANEKNALLDYFKSNLSLSDAQRAQLTKDVEQKIALSDVWGAITAPQDRAFLIDIAPTLFVTHGAPTAEEKAVLAKMTADQLATIDSAGVQKELAAIKALAPAERLQDEAEYREEFNNWGRVGRLLYHFDTMLDNRVKNIN